MEFYSRKIFGWQLQGHMREELVTEALQKALPSRKVKEGLILHSDRGGQYAGTRFRSVMEKKEMLHRMSRADNAYDNAFMESCFSRFKAELLEGGAFAKGEDAQTEIFEFIEMDCNTRRRHSSPKYQSPMDCDNKYHFYKP